MSIARIAPEVALSSQLKVEDLPQIAAEGFRSIINNRPDGEEPGQPSSAQLQAAAKQCGLAYRHIPVTPGQIGEEAVTEFERALGALPLPVLAFCRTGIRAASLWALTEAKRSKADEIIIAAAAVGYDLQNLHPRLAAAASECGENYDGPA